MLVGFYWLDSWMRVMQSLGAPPAPAPAPKTAHEDEAAALREDMVQLRAAIEERDQALTTAQAEQAALARSFNVEQRASISARLLARQLHLAYAARCSELQATVEGLEAQIAVADRAAFSAGGLARQLRRAYAACCSELQATVAGLEAQLAAADRAAFSAGGLARQLQAAYATRATELAEALEAMSARSAETGEELELADAARTEAQSQADEVRLLLAAARGDAADARTEIDRLTARIGDLDELARVKEQNTAAELAEVNQRLALALERLNGADAAQADAVAHTQRLQTALDDLTAERDDLARRLAEAEEARSAGSGTSPADSEHGTKRPKARARKAKPESMPARVAPAPAAEFTPPPPAPVVSAAMVNATEGEGEPGLLIGFRKPADWTAPVYVYFWETQPPIETPAWPGVLMQEDAYGWCAQRLSGVQAASLVFTDSAGHQTANLRRDADGWLDTDGRWSRQRP